MKNNLWSVLIGAIVLGTAVVAAGAAPSTRPSSAAPIRQWIPSGFHAIRDIPYVAHGGRSQTLDVYVPDGRTLPRPLVIWIHGGGWMGGDKAMPPGLGLLSRGFVVASINYRTTREALFPAQIYDCKAAIRFLRAHAAEFAIDPNHIGVWGDSAGGHLAALLGVTNGLRAYEGSEGNLYYSSSVQAVCDWFGPTDFLQGSDLNGYGGAAVVSLFGGAIGQHLELARMASPAEQIGQAILPPFLIMHGNEDLWVPLHQSQVFFDRLQKAGDWVKLEVLPGSGHGTGAFRNLQIYSQVGDFFAAQLKNTSLPTYRPATRPTF